MSSTQHGFISLKHCPGEKGVRKKWQDGEKIRNKEARINKNARKMYIKLKKTERKLKAYKTES